MPKARTTSKPAAARSRPVAPQPVPTKARHDGWTPERQTGFLDALAAHGCVSEACAAVGMSSQSAYRLRMRPDAQGFRVAWEAALDLGIRRLTDACLSRALHGEAIPHYYQGEQVGEHRRYDNRLAMFLLRYRDPLRYAASLDQMVYSGHPEAAAVAYMKAHHRAADEAWGVADEPVAAPEAPYTRQPIAEATAQARAEAEEEALVAGDGPVGGSDERRRRILAKRRERARAEELDTHGPPTLGDAEMDKTFPGWLKSRERAWRQTLNDLPPHDRERRIAEAMRRPDVLRPLSPSEPSAPAGVDGAAADRAAVVAPNRRPAGQGRLGGDVASPSSPLVVCPPRRPPPPPPSVRLFGDGAG